MKKLLLLSTLICLCFNVYGQGNIFLTTGAKTCDTDVSIWHCDASWDRSTTTYAGDPAELTAEMIAALGVQAGGAQSFPGVMKREPNDFTQHAAGVNMPNIVVVRSGHSLYLTDHVLYEGYIILEEGANLYFNKPGGDQGRLSMENAASVIELRGTTSSFLSNATGSNGDPSNFLVIGTLETSKVNGHYINMLPSPMANITPLYVDQEFLRCLKGLGGPEPEKVWTEAELWALVNCAGPTPQPVELLSMNAKSMGTGVELKWTIAKEWNFSHYEVEWSTDGQQFSTAGSVSGKGTESGPQQYTFLHQPGQMGTLYYRLLAVDIDGTVEDKGTKVVRTGGELFNVYAKQGRLHINYNGPSESKVTVLDTTGRMISQSSLAADGLETAGLRPGIYLVQISNVLERKTQRVLIQ